MVRKGLKGRRFKGGDMEWVRGNSLLNPFPPTHSTLSTPVHHLISKLKTKVYFSQKWVDKLIIDTVV